jgi:large subunit ribosomal protein L21
MEPYAVVETGGKQYRVKTGDTLKVELLAGEVGQTVELGAVLALSDGQDLKIGAPLVAGAKVSAEIVKTIRGEKVVAFKKKRRKGYKRKVGHRQKLMVIKVSSIQ